MAKIFVSFTIVSTANFFLVARENDAPLAEVYRSDVLEPPHIQRNITIDGLNPVMHRVELWTTLDGVTLNQLRGRCDIDASLQSQLAFEPIQFIAGRGFGAPQYDPTPDTDEYINPDTAGKEVIYFKPGFGPLHWDVHIEKRLDINGNDLGGFKYINGQVFGDGEEYTGLISNLTTVQNTGSGNGYPDGIVTVSSNIDFSSTHYRKLIEVIPTSNLTINILDIDTIPEGMLFGINTHNLPNSIFKACTLQLPSGKYCLINGYQRNAAYICRAESVTFMKLGAYLRIINGGEPFNQVGRRFYADGNINSLPPVNSVPLTGGWHLKTDVPRIAEWYVPYLPPAEIGIGFDDDQEPDATQRTKWIIGTNKIWFPDHGGYFYRGTDPDGNIDSSGSRLANTIQQDSNKSHNHVDPPFNRSAARASDVDNTNTPGSVDSNNPTSEYRVAGMNSGHWTAATIISSGGAEAVPKNLAANAYVLI